MFLALSCWAPKNTTIPTIHNLRKPVPNVSWQQLRLAVYSNMAAELDSSLIALPLLVPILVHALLKAS